MARGKHIPTVASARLSRELREQRTQAKMSQEAVAEQMGWAESKLYRIENDKSRVLLRDVNRLLELYRTGEEQRAALLELARLAGEPNWWHKYSGAIPEWFQIYVVLEASASEALGYEPELVPGIMQTERYARAIMSTSPVRPSDEDIENSVTIRTNRQKRLTGSGPLNLWIILNEAVVRRVIGSPQIMREQLEHLVRLALLRNITLQIIPFGIGEHGAMHGGFYLLKFPSQNDPDKVYMEHHIGGLYTQKDHEVDRYRMILDDLRARALGPKQTLELLRSAADELS